MAKTESFVTTVNNSGLWGQFTADDGGFDRIRDGQTFVGEEFGNLAVPAGATIDGIRIEMEGFAGHSSHDTEVGDWISVSNDSGTTFSTAQSVTTGLWATTSGTMAVESAGGTSELWGMTWDADSANAIQVRMGWGTTGGDAVYLDYVKVEIYYTAGTAAPGGTRELPNCNVTSGILVFKGGLTEIK